MGLKFIEVLNIQFIIERNSQTSATSVSTNTKDHFPLNNCHLPLETNINVSRGKGEHDNLP